MIEKTLAWFEQAGQIPAGAPPSVKQVEFYLGMQIEELAEKLTAIASAILDPLEGGPTHQLKVLADQMNFVADGLKSERFKNVIDAALHSGLIRENMLDADCDLLWVTVGAAAAQDARVREAYEEVLRANYDKFRDGVRKDPDTGKILKPDGWAAPFLAPFVSTKVAT